MKRLLVLAFLALCNVPARAQVMMAAQGDVTMNPGGSSLDVGGHVSWRTPSHLGLDGAIAVSLFGDGRYDFADGDISIDAIPLFSRITLAPRAGLSSVIINDYHALNGMNAAIALRRRRSNGDFFRVDAIYRRVGGYGLGTIAVGIEFKLGGRE